MGDALEDLVAAVRDGTVLTWVLRHAPDGDADGAIARAWRGCPYDHPLRMLVWYLGSEFPACHALAEHWAGEGCGRVGCCADVVRRAVPTPPTLAELLAARGPR